MQNNRLPYTNTIDKIKYLAKIECPLTKLDMIFRIFTEIMTQELCDFWNGVKEVAPKDLFINSSNLKKLMVYVLIKNQKSKIYVDLQIIQEFMPFVLKYTNRAYYVTMLQSAFEFIEDITEVKIKELTSKCGESNVIDEEAEIQEEVQIQTESKHLKIV